jgi:hypothetical protein
VWKFVFTGVGRKWLVGEIDAPRRRQDGLLGQGLHILDPAGLTLVAGEFENRVDGAEPIGQEYRAQSYLRRIVVLTGATQRGNSYVLDVGKTEFSVRNGYVRRLRDVTDPKCKYEETCFYSAYKGMPKAKQIATVLLLLTNNPALFDKWAAQSGAYKADGQVFTSAQ